MLSKRTLIYGAVVLAVLAAAYIYIFHIAQLQISTEEKAARELLSKHVIYYECKRDATFTNLNYDICAINADGSERREIMGDQGTETTFGSLAINNLGDIVFHCEYNEVGVGGIQHNVCALLNNASGVQRLDFPKWQRRSDLIGFNDARQVVTSCEERLCMGQVGAEGYGEIPNSDSNGQAIGPAINNHSQIAYSCWFLGNERSREICAIMPDGSGFRVLTESGDGRAFNPRLLDSGEHIYNCGDETDLFNICAVNDDGSQQRQLTEAEGRADMLNPAVNTHLGMIVYECWSDVEHGHLCVMNTDGSDQRQLTPDPEHDGPYRYINPSISDAGLVAFGCDDELCVIQSDGSGMRQLTGDQRTDFGARRPIIYQRAE